MRTYSAKPGEVERHWFIVDAADQPLGRTASKIAVILQGKHKPTYTPHVDTGDFVVVVNAAKVKLTGRKLENKLYYRHSGWVGGLTSQTAKELLQSKPTEALKRAVKGMLPRTTLGREMLGKLKLHAGACPAHGYKAQNAQPLSLTGS